MKEKTFNKIVTISLISVIVVALVASITFVCVKRSEGIPEEESANLLAQEHLLTEDFSNLSSIEGVESRTTEDKVIVTFYEKETKLEAIYNKDYKLISSAIIKNGPYDSAAGVVLTIVIGGVTAPAIIWLVVMILIAVVYDGIVALKKIRYKKEKQDERG